METMEMIKDDPYDADRDIIRKLVESTRIYAVNLARNLLNDDEKALSVVKEAYEELIFSDEVYDNSSFTDALKETISNKAERYLKESAKLTDINETTEDEFALSDIDIDKYREYYDDPKAENEVNEIINQLDTQEKLILIDTYYSDDGLETAAKRRGVSRDTVQYYLNKANRKISEIDYDKVAKVYSLIKLGISVMELDFVGIGIGEAKDRLKEKLSKNKDEENSLRSFLKETLKGEIDDWFFDRFRSLLTTSAAGAASKAAVTARSAGTKSAVSGAVKGIRAALIKKLAITATAAVVTVGGGVAIYKETVRSKALKYMEEVFDTKMFDSNKQVTAGDLREALEVCWDLDKYFVYDEGMSDDTKLDDFFLMWPLVKYYWPEVEADWDAIDWSRYPDNEWYPGLLTSEKFIMDNGLTKGYNTKAKGIIMKDFAILIMNCDKFYKENR